MNDGPIFEWGPDMPIDVDVADDESSPADDVVSVSSVPIVPLFLPQPIPPFPADNGSIHSAGSTTNANVSSDDDDTNTLAPVDNPAPIDDAPADVAPDEHMLAAADAAAHDLLVPEVVPLDAPDKVSFDDVADDPDDVSLDDVANASPM